MRPELVMAVAIAAVACVTRLSLSAYDSNLPDLRTWAAPVAATLLAWAAWWHRSWVDATVGGWQRRREPHETEGAANKKLCAR